MGLRLMAAMAFYGAASRMMASNFNVELCFRLVHEMDMHIGTPLFWLHNVQSRRIRQY